jgi:hypothetical protein
MSQISLILLFIANSLILPYSFLKYMLALHSLLFRLNLLLNLWPYATEIREPVCLCGTTLQVCHNQPFSSELVVAVAEEVFPEVKS